MVSEHLPIRCTGDSGPAVHVVMVVDGQILRVQVESVALSSRPVNCQVSGAVPECQRREQKMRRARITGSVKTWPELEMKWFSTRLPRICTAETAGRSSIS